MKPSAPILALLAMTLTLLLGCRKESAPLTAKIGPAASVRVQTAERKHTLGTEDVVGTVQAKLHASIEARISARIERMLVAPGQAVQAGQVLIELDAGEISARLQQALAQRDQAARDTERLRTLLDQRAVSRQDFETAESRHRVAIAAVNEAESMLAYTKVTAPFSGVITRKLADLGDFAAPGKPLLHIEDPALHRFEADVPESLITRLELGGRLTVRISQLDQQFEATITEIAPAADPTTRTFLVKLDLPPAKSLRSGLFGRLAVPTRETHALRVSQTAVIQRGQLQFVFVASSNQAVLRIVKTGRLLGSEIELVSGIEPGDHVVIEGAGQLRDGQSLQTRP